MLHFLRWVRPNRLCRYSNSPIPNNAIFLTAPLDANFSIDQATGHFKAESMLPRSGKACYCDLSALLFIQDRLQHPDQDPIDDVYPPAYYSPALGLYTISNGASLPIPLDAVVYTPTSYWHLYPQANVHASTNDFPVSAHIFTCADSAIRYLVVQWNRLSPI